MEKNKLMVTFGDHLKERAPKAPPPLRGGTGVTSFTSCFL